MAELKVRAYELYNLIYIIDCYNTSDILLYDDIMSELQKRNAKVSLELSFN